MFGPLGFLLIWDAWTYLLDFSSDVQGSVLNSASVPNSLLKKVRISEELKCPPCAERTDPTAQL